MHIYMYRHAFVFVIFFFMRVQIQTTQIRGGEVCETICPVGFLTWHDTAFVKCERVTLAENATLTKEIDTDRYLLWIQWQVDKKINKNTITGGISLPKCLTWLEQYTYYCTDRNTGREN